MAKTDKKRTLYSNHGKKLKLWHKSLGVWVEVNKYNGCITSIQMIGEFHGLTK